MTTNPLDTAMRLLAAQRAGDVAEMERIRAGLTVAEVDDVIEAMTSELTERLVGELDTADDAD